MEWATSEMHAALAPGPVMPGMAPVGLPMGMSFGVNPKGKGKGKGKKKGKNKGTGEVKPMVNPNQLNPAKEPHDGGVNFKTMLQERIAKHLHRAIQPGDIDYSVNRAPGGKTATLTIIALGPEHVYPCTRPGRDDKQAGQFAAAQAMEQLFPDLHVACFEAHAAARETMMAGGGPGVEVVGNCEPKGLLNGRISLVVGRQLCPGDVNYATQWNPMLNGFGSVLTVPCLGDASLVYASDEEGLQDPKAAEKDAAKKCLEANKSLFDQAAALGAQKKERMAVRVKGYKGQGKGVALNNSYTPY